MHRNSIFILFVILSSLFSSLEIVLADTQAENTKGKIVQEDEVQDESTSDSVTSTYKGGIVKQASPSENQEEETEDEPQTDISQPTPSQSSFSKKEEKTQTSSQAPTTPQPNSPVPPTSSTTTPSKGKMFVTYKQPSKSVKLTKNSDLSIIYKMLTETKIFSDLADGVNADFNLPIDLKVIFESCDEDNAYYDAETHQITMCYELMETFFQNFREAGDSEEEQVVAVVGAGMFTFLHELGHALVDIFELAVVGNEEDAVDQLAVLILIEAEDSGVDAVLSAAKHFQASADATDPEDIALWEEHSLDGQRVYNLMCLVYGSDPIKYKRLVDDDNGLPEERASVCEYDYQQKSRSWEKLLEKYMKTNES